MSAPASRLVFAGLCVLAAFAPLAFGAVEGWARAVLLAMTWLLALVWLGDAVLRGRFLFRPTLLYVPMVVFLTVVGLQLGLNRSLYRHATREELLWTVGLALVWVLVLNALNPKELRRLPVFFCAFGFVLAVFAILQGLAAPHDTIYLFRDLSQGPTAYGPFVNKNHYAGYMELLAPLPPALVMFGAVRREQRGLFLFLGLVMMVSVALSGSRTGAAIVVLQTLLLGWMSLRGRRGRARAGGAVLLLLLVAAGAAWLGGRPLVDHLSTLLHSPSETSLTARLQADRDTLAMARDHALWGTGLATFGAVFPRYKSFEDDLFWEHAHNDLLQLAAECGVAGTACVLLFLAGLGWLWKGAREKRAGGDGAAMAGIFVGCVGLLLHSLLDFHFRIPATALTFVILYALGLALAKSSAVRVTK